MAVCGSNDVDNYNNLTAMRHEEIENDFMYLNTVENDAREWLVNLKPHIINLFLEMLARSNSARLGYILIIPPSYWSKEAIYFAPDLDYYVVSGLKKEANIHVKMLPTRSLFYNPRRTDAPNFTCDEVVKAFLDTDNTHLNMLGVEAVMNDVALLIMHYLVAANVANGMI